MKIVILLGSDSDQNTLDESKAVEQLEAVGITVVVVPRVSAHRNGRKLAAWLDQNENEYDGFIAVAGLANALAGAVAGHINTGEFRPKPVLGVPLDEFGIDPIMHTAPGVPVPCFAPGKRGLQQAALFMAIALSVGDDELAKQLQKYIAGTNKPPIFPT